LNLHFSHRRGLPHRPRVWDFTSWHRHFSSSNGSGSKVY
jgi:hypothetical protein